MKKSLKVFLSGTVKDLAPEREIATRAVEALKLEAVRVETFGSSPRTPQEICKEMVHECDVFIGIYGGRYGYVSPGQPLSVTEMEFQEARQAGKDILVYTKDNVKPDSKQAAFLRRADDFEAGYFRRPHFRTLSELEEWIKEDLIALLSSRFVTTALPKANTVTDEYRSYVSTLYERMTFAGLAETPSGLSLPLEKVFIDPYLRELQPSGEVVGSKTWDFYEAFSQSRRTVVVGAPGSGKTMLLKNLARITAERSAAAKESILLPILVPVLSLVGDSTERFDRRICRFIASRTQPRFESVIQDALSSGTALLLLDGLDEIDQPDALNRVIADFESFCKAYPNLRVVLTTRPSGWRSILDFQSYEILPWTEEQISRFVHQWSAALNEDLEFSGPPDEQASELFTSITGHRDLLELARNPLFLTLLAFLHRQAYRLPTRRVELYDAIVKTMVGAWDRARSLSHTLPRIFRQADIERFLSTVAFEMTIRGLRTITVSEIESFAADNIEHQELSEEGVQNLLTELSNRTGLLLETAEGRYSFVHVIFQEFFAAKAIVAMQDDHAVGFITEHFYDPQFEEVVRLALSWIGAHSERQSLVARATEELLNAAQD